MCVLSCPKGFKLIYEIYTLNPILEYQFRLQGQKHSLIYIISFEILKDMHATGSDYLCSRYMCNLLHPTFKISLMRIISFLNDHRTKNVRHRELFRINICHKITEEFQSTYF